MDKTKKYLTISFIVVLSPLSSYPLWGAVAEEKAGYPSGTD